MIESRVPNYVPIHIPYVSNALMDLNYRILANQRWLIHYTVRSNVQKPSNDLIIDLLTEILKILIILE